MDKNTKLHVINAKSLILTDKMKDCFLILQRKL